MPKFPWQASYTAQGAQGLQKDGGLARRAAVQRLTEQAGGKLESFYFALGESDVYVIAELPDATTAVAVSLAVNAVGAAHLRTVPLLTAEEMDTATKKAVDYRPPGAAGKP
ncbi:MAG: GYD domain-containing protein [Gemmatimonadales bacterium]